LCLVLTDECPAHTTKAGHVSGAVDCLDRSDRAGVILDKIMTIRRDGKCAETDSGGCNVVTWDEYSELCSVLTDESPAHTTKSGRVSGAIDCLDRSDIAGVILDKITTIWRDGKCSAGFENDVDDVVGDVCTRQKGGHEVRVKVRAGEMRVESRWEIAMAVRLQM
jgi:hypothetical protein